MPRRPVFGPALPPAMKKARAAAKRAARSLTKNQKVQVKRIITGKSETKYVADTPIVYGGGAIVKNYAVLQSVVSGGVGTTAWGLIPFLTQGTNGAQRLGNKISNVTLKCNFMFWLNPNLSGNPSLDMTVRLYICKAKPIKSQSQLTNLPVGAFLDNGDATSIDWTATTPVQDMLLSTYPVNKEVFTVLKVKSFRLARNQDSPTGAVGLGAAPNLPANQHHNFSYTHKHKGTVVYPDNNVSGFQTPENLNLFCFAVYYDTNGFATAPPTPSPVLVSTRSHMWYKDM